MAERATFSKAVLFAQQGRLSEARRAIAAGAASVGPIAAAIFRARLLLAAGAWEDVARTELPILRSVHGPSRAEALATCAIAEERLGRLHEARATLMTAITCGGGARHEKSLGALLQRGGNLEAALRAFEASAAHEPRPAERVDAALSAARTAAAAEAWDQAGDWAERAVDVAGPRDAETATAAAQILAAADRWDRAREILGAAAAHHPNHPEIEAIFVRWDLWRGDAEGARARAARGALRAEDRDLALAIAAILRSDPEAALALADRVVAMSPASAEARIVRAEAHLLLGSFEAARADAHEAQAHARGYTFAALLIHRLATVIEESRWPGRSRYAFEEIELPLVALCPEAPPILWSSDAAAFIAVLKKALGRLGGNRSAAATFIAKGEPGPTAELARLSPATGPRHASRRALERIRVDPPEEALAAIDATIAAFPASPMPLAHRGELLLWLGRHEDAHRDFVAALAMEHGTRWGYIGRGAAELLMGDPERALATFAEGQVVMRGSTGPSLFIYRGEALFRAGKPDDALLDLRRCCEDTPFRLSAWLVRALAAHASENYEEFRTSFEVALREGRGLMADVAASMEVTPWPPPSAPSAELAVRMIEGALAMMRGNRSSSCITYFTPKGALRTVPILRAGKDRRAEEMARLEGMARRLDRVSG